jgi:hypothetical protein
MKHITETRFTCVSCVFHVCLMCVCSVLAETPATTLSYTTLTLHLILGFTESDLHCELRLLKTFDSCKG